ncbi:DUF1206 domain-containing protein [Amycolatopsis sp. WAC 01376]|uniref:DUF1206 domain-containing protein n=1 Tax=Amycolatopsis sp. WAC 01376 TaxID=2203195 RepID=UPI000F77481D|nr:DUF1206 domain-containing protein [Amycolatopsis sp. WAC 01376]RSM63740.1 DUF1206 domain-containing protein [Amycolatopsis sp. WAC 01376]
MSATEARQVRHNKAVQLLGRIGMGCYGLVYLLIGYLAVRVAVDGGGQEADGRGAITEVGSTPVGGVLLWILAAGLVAYGLWQALLAAVGYTWIGKQRTRTVKRVTSGVRCLVGISLGVYAARVAAGAGQQGSGDQKQQEFTARLLALPAGPLLVTVVAVIVFGVAVGSVVKGVRRTFEQDLDLSRLPSGTRRWVERLGRIGYVARGVVFGMVAVLVGYAALTHDASRSGGLDAALRTLAAQPFGAVLLIVVAIGVAAFGAYCLGAARAQRG